MFSWIKGLFAGANSPHVATPSSKPAHRPSTSVQVDPVDLPTTKAMGGGTLGYRPDLINKLMGDHRALLKLYGQVMTDAGNKNWSAVAQQLIQFKSSLQDHLLDEAVRLYVYLQKNTEDDEAKTLIRNFRIEMEQIGRAVLKMLDRFEGIADSAYLQMLFASEWKVIGATLGDRIAREERALYPLYA